MDEPYTTERGLITSADFEPSELELIESATQSGNAEFAVVTIIIVVLLGFLFLFLARQHGKSLVVQPTPSPRSASSSTPVGTWVDRDDERAIEFNRDGTFLAIAPSSPLKGKWKIKGEKICLFEFTIETDVEICGDYKQNGDVMIYGDVIYDRMRK